ncbi:MAG: T9SS type A sorting domain-containing protein [Gemmatimonadota bacterium]|nr:MAG: T9SS type A sorting domain-containing protein [Gemmatimonadota bacterium]
MTGEGEIETMDNRLKILRSSIILGFLLFLFQGNATAQPPSLLAPQLFYSPVDGGIKLIWDNRAETMDNPLESNNLFIGYRIYRAQYTIEEWHLIAAFDNSDDSVYVIDEKGDTLNNGLRVDLPPITHSYTDSGGTFLDRDISRPINGLPYFYTVTAYGHPHVETERDNYMKKDDGTPIAVYPTKRYETGHDKSGLADVKVVPNPYKATSLFEVRYEDKIMFTNLPPAAVISIYSLEGDLVETIIHDSGTDSEMWNLISRNDQFVVSGLYYYVVQTESEKKIGKFVIMR